MNEWKGERKEGRKEGRKEERKNGWLNGWMDEKKEGKKKEGKRKKERKEKKEGNSFCLDYELLVLSWYIIHNITYCLLSEAIQCIDCRIERIVTTLQLISASHLDAWPALVLSLLQVQLEVWLQVQLQVQLEVWLQVQLEVWLQVQLEVWLQVQKWAGRNESPQLLLLLSLQLSLSWDLPRWIQQCPLHFSFFLVKIIIRIMINMNMIIIIIIIIIICHRIFGGDRIIPENDPKTENASETEVAPWRYENQNETLTYAHALNTVLPNRARDYLLFRSLLFVPDIPAVECNLSGTDVGPKHNLWLHCLVSYLQPDLQQQQ